MSAELMVTFARQNTQASYKYLGVGKIVEEDYEDIDVKLSYLDSNGNVTGLDRFGRVADQVWTDYGSEIPTWSSTVILIPTIALAIARARRMYSTVL